MRAVVLVGGEGTRLRPLTNTIPKQLLPVANLPLLERVLERLGAHGVTDVVLSMGYKADAFRTAYPDGECAGLPLTYVIEETPLDTAGAIGFAAREAGIDDTFMVVNSDVLHDFDLGALTSFHRGSGAVATIALAPVADPSDMGVVVHGLDGRVSAFIEKPGPGRAPTNLVNAGTYVMEPSVIDRIPTGRRVNVEREIFPALVDDGELFALDLGAWWLDVGTPRRYLEANLHLLDRAPVLPGDGTVVDPLARVDRSVIGACCRIGASRVCESVVMDDAEIADDVEIVRSIIGPGVALAPGTRLTEGSVVVA
ncbi:MAG TPA: NDP-sugar synthase [Acidimicrobiales bacterium]|nr:NDP-sugar synthase [Acidimicrobiales bacterium]